MSEDEQGKPEKKRAKEIDQHPITVRLQHSGESLSEKAASSGRTLSSIARLPSRLRGRSRGERAIGPRKLWILGDGEGI
jgi:hypothetical protein